MTAFFMPSEASSQRSPDGKPRSGLEVGGGDLHSRLFLSRFSASHPSLAGLAGWQRHFLHRRGGNLADGDLRTGVLRASDLEAQDFLGSFSYPLIGGKGHRLK